MLTEKLINQNQSSQGLGAMTGVTHITVFQYVMSSLPPFWAHGRRTWNMPWPMKGKQRCQSLLGERYLRSTLQFFTFSSFWCESGDIPNGRASVSLSPGVGLPLSVHAGHVAWARNKPLLFKAWRFERLFVTATGLHVSPRWLIKLRPGIWNTIPGTTYTGNLNLSAHIWRRRFAVQKQIKEAKPSLFSLFPQRDLSVGSLIST